MREIHYRLAALAALSLSLGACASITRGTDETVTFTSTPSGAAVTTSTNLSCSPTPCTIEVPRSDQFVATFTKPGYLPEEVIVSVKISPNGALGLVGNGIVGGIVGVVVDASTGAAQDHKPNPVVATLRPAGGGKALRRRARPTTG